MSSLFDDSTIIACSTSQGSSAAIAVIRLSGFGKIRDFQDFFSFDLNKVSARKMYQSHLHDGGKVIDDICFCYFQAPFSFNGENILELYVHGNLLNIDRVLDLFLKSSLVRLAQPGEFARRALVNGKLDLAQVEGLDLMLNSSSGMGIDQGLSLLSGSLHQEYLDLYQLFLDHRSHLEVLSDFSEDLGEEVALESFKNSLTALQIKISALYQRTSVNVDALLLPEIVLAGPPNSGKSSLFNHLLAQKRSIVSPVAGTTRDFVSERIKVGDHFFKLIDTAGMRESEDAIEREGIDFSKDKLSKSFFRVLLINPLSFDLAELENYLKFNFDLVIFTHKDVEGFSSQIKEFKNCISGRVSFLEVSLVSPDLVLWDQLKDYFINKINLAQASNPVLLPRQKRVISNTYNVFEEYLEICSSEEFDLGVISLLNTKLADCLSELIGIISPAEVLDNIFSNFCIGK